MSTPSSILRLELLGDGEQPGTWGQTTNTNLGTLLEAAIAGLVSVSVTSANQALTIANYAPDQARRAIISLSTTTGANFNVYAPPVSKTYIIQNTSAYTATIYNSTVAGNTTAAGSGVAIPAGGVAYVFSNGTNFYSFNSLYGGSSIAIRADSSGNVGVGPATTIQGKFNVASGRAFFGANSELFSIGVGYTQARVNSNETYYIGASDSATPDLVFSNSAGLERVRFDTSGNVGVGTTAPQTRVHVQQTSATTNAVTQVLRLDSQSSGTPAIGIGVGMEFAAETSAGNTEVGVVLEAVTTDVIAASEDFDLVFKTMQNGAAATERVRLTAAGNVGIGTSNPSTILSLSRSSACVAQFDNGTATAQVGAFGTNVAAFGSSTNHPTRFLINGNIQAGIETSGAFQFNSGYGSSATAFGCRAWINFNGTGTPAIRGSGNVTSITDNGVADYTVNFTNAMPDTNYAALATVTYQSGYDPSVVFFASEYARTTGTISFYTGYVSGTAAFSYRANIDVTTVNVAIFR